MSDGVLSVPSNIFPFLNFRLITPNDILALEYIHYKLFPIRYGRIFYEKICNDNDNPKLIDNNDNNIDNNDDYSLMKWNSEHLIGIGVFYKHINKDVSDNSNNINQIDNNITQYNSNIDQNCINVTKNNETKISNLYLVGDEYLIGVITFLMNFPNENVLQSGDVEYEKIYNYYKLVIDQTNNIGKCGMINTNLINNNIYNMLINCLYSNDVLINKITKILYNKSLQSVYILTAGVIESFQRKGIGTTLILFVQLLFQRILYDNILTLSNGNYEWICTNNNKEYNNDIPPFIYLHVLEYNEAAHRMYYNANLVNITKVKNYYSINCNMYDANMLCCYIEPQCNINKHHIVDTISKIL